MRIFLLVCLALHPLLSAWAASAQTAFTHDPAGNLAAASNLVAAVPAFATTPRFLSAQSNGLLSVCAPVTGTGPFTYQWLLNGSPVAGATNDCYFLPNATSAQLGNYQLVAANAAGSATSAVINVSFDTDHNGLPDAWELACFGHLGNSPTADPDGDGISNAAEAIDGTAPNDARSFKLPGAQVPIAAPAGLIGWWPGNGNALDMASTNNGVLTNGATFAPAMVGQGFSLDGIKSHVLVPHNPAFNLTGSLAIEVWIQPTIPLSQQKEWARIVDKEFVSGSLVRSGFSLYSFGSNDAGPGFLAFEVYTSAGQKLVVNSGMGDLAVPGVFTHIIGEYDQPAGILRLFVNGVLRGEQWVGSAQVGTNTLPLRFGTDNRTNSQVQSFQGVIDEVSLYNRALSSQEAAVIYAAGNAGKSISPMIHNQPQSITVVEGASVTLTASVDGFPLDYQWLKNGQPIPDAVTATYSIPAATMNDAGVYSLMVGNQVGLGSSDIATVTVTTAAASLIHRYSFTTDASDSVGHADGTLMNGALVSGGQLRLNGTNQYASLPGGLLTGLSSVTVEFWASFGTNAIWNRVFDFGDRNATNAGRNYLMFSPHTGYSNQRMSIADGDPGNTHEEFLAASGVLDGRSNVHVVCVWNGFDSTMSLFTNGVMASSSAFSIPLSHVINTFSWLGRSLFEGDAYLKGSIDELRIYNAALPAVQITANYRRGPDAAPRSPSPGLIHRYSFTTDASDSVGSAHGTLVNGASVMAGQVQLNGTNQYVNLPTGMLNGLSSVTMEFWASLGTNATWACVYNFGGAAGLSQALTLLIFTPHNGNTGHTLQITETGSIIEYVASHGLLDGRTNLHVVCVLDPPSGVMSIYTNGVLECTGSMTNPLASVASTVGWLGRTYLSPNPYLNGSIDEFRMYNGARTALEIADDYAQGPDAVIATPPVILRSPQEQQVVGGSSVTFSVSAIGSGTLRYQWYRDGVAIGGATNASLNLPLATGNAAGAYSVRVGNDFGAVTSTDALLTVVQHAPTPLLGLADVWRYNQSGADLGTAWKEKVFDDSLWPSGHGVFACEDNAAVVALTGTGLSLSNASGQRVLTYYFRTHFNCPNEPGLVYLIASNLVDDGAVFYLNGAEIYRIQHARWTGVRCHVGEGRSGRGERRGFCCH